MERIPSSKKLPQHSQFARILHNSSQQQLMTSPLKSQSPMSVQNHQLSHRSYLRIKSRIEQLSMPEKELKNKLRQMERERSQTRLSETVSTQSHEPSLTLDFNNNLMQMASQMRQLSAVKEYFKKQQLLIPEPESPEQRGGRNLSQLANVKSDTNLPMLTRNLLKTSFKLSPKQSFIEGTLSPSKSNANLPRPYPFGQMKLKHKQSIVETLEEKNNSKNCTCPDPICKTKHYLEQIARDQQTSMFEMSDSRDSTHRISQMLNNLDQPKSQLPKVMSQSRNADYQKEIFLEAQLRNTQKTFNPLIEKGLKIKESFMKTQTNIKYQQLNQKGNSRFLPIIQSKLERNARESMDLHLQQVKSQLFYLPLNQIPEQQEQKREFTADTNKLMDRLNSPINDQSANSEDEILKEQYTKHGEHPLQLNSTTRNILQWESKNLVDSEKKIQRYMKSYKDIDKIEQKEIANRSPQKDPIQQYLKSITKSHMPPHKIAFQKSIIPEDDNESVDPPSGESPNRRSLGLKSYYLNQSFAEAFSQNLKINRNLERLTLKNTKLNDTSFTHLLENLPSKLKKLDISRNPTLTIKSYNALFKHFRQIRSKLTHLNLENNKIGDEVCKELCDLILELGAIQVLNLSKCNITDVGAIQIAEVLDTPGLNLRTLLLHWNLIKGKGSVAIAKAMKRNTTLQILDASFNAFGSGQLRLKKNFRQGNKSARKRSLSKTPRGGETQREEEDKNEKYTQSAYKWARTLSQNKSLIHIDFSFNSFKVDDIRVIGEQLKQNHTVMGMHLMGNYARVDELGFVTPEQSLDAAATHCFTRIPKNLKIGQISNRQLLDLKVSSNCWICEGWTRMQFKITRLQALGQSLPPKKAPGQYTTLEEKQLSAVYLHLNFEGFKPMRMLEVTENQESYFTLHRMIPPGSLTYFYSVGDPQLATTDPTKGLVTVTDQASPTKKVEQQQLQMAMGEHNQITVKVPRVNYCDEDIDIQAGSLRVEELNLIKGLPRAEAIVDEKDEKPKTPWSFDKSIFGSYTQDTDEIMLNCFDFDWHSGKLEKVAMKYQKEQRDKVYNYLLKNYLIIKEAYKYFSAQSPAGIIPSIGLNVFSDIIYNLNVIDYKTVKLSDVDLHFVSTLASGNQYKTRTNPERQLIRFQFLEILVRIAIDKYLKSKICHTFEGAIVKFFEEHVFPYFKNYRYCDFRTQRLWTEQCDTVYKKYLTPLKEIYRVYSGREVLPNEEMNMSMNEFIDLITATRVVDDNFGAREISILFNLSMMTQVDEINKARHIKMYFVEFLEAIARVSDRVITSQMLYGVGSQQVIQENDEEPSARSSTQVKNEIPLEVKIQEYIKKMATLAMTDDFGYNFLKKYNTSQLLGGSSKLTSLRFSKKLTGKGGQETGRSDTISNRSSGLQSIK